MDRRPAEASLLRQVAIATCALILTIVLAGLVGGALAVASRLLLLFALYDVAAALVLGAGTVALCHLLRLRPGRLAVVIAATAAVVQLGAFQVSSAWLFTVEQARWIHEHPDLEVQDLAVAGVDDAPALVDAGLQAETGHTGWVGGWLAQWKYGVVVWRSGDMQRAVPMPAWLRALVLGGEAAFVALVVWRALHHLQGEPVCARCGRFLRRRLRLRLDGQAAADLAQAWSRGDRPTPASGNGPQVAVLYEETCPAGHSGAPGLSLVSLRRRGWSARTPGPWASVPPEIDS